MTIGEIEKKLHEWVPASWAESYDNVGLLVGKREAAVRGVLVSLDVTEDIIEEAVQQDCQLIVAHHPLIFKGIKQLTSDHWVQRTVIKAIEKGIGILVAHTNLDNASDGVNARLGEKLGLSDLRILRPFQERLLKLVTYVPVDHLEKVREGLFAAGAGQVGDRYDECSFVIQGKGSFRPNAKADPFTGSSGVRSVEEEFRLEVILKDSDQRSVLSALNSCHPYEEVAYELLRILNPEADRGAGMIGLLKEPLRPEALFTQIKEALNIPVIRHSRVPDRLIRSVAFCGGSGFFLLEDAVAASADVFLTSDIKYHDFFEADNRILLADIGHYEGEQYSCDLLVEKLRSFATFAVRLSEKPTNPISYT
ncbi:MAG: GTP cyclohydrolase 1 type 2 [Flavobacteriia bacterium]|nr:MAG: GTP cyclohydrolase 1 type 2 [Flavobacteriia bacterium]